MSTTIRFQSYYPKTDAECIEEIQSLRAQLGDECLILGHYYQRDEVYQFADVTGDSLQLSYAAGNTKAPYIVFCGVHFMAEVADMLTSEQQAVILPDMAAGCSMADMANTAQVKTCWEAMSSVFDPDDTVMPITYVNSAASLKAFCHDHGGTVCTSSNARAILEWGLQHREKVLFFPDQHLGRNTAHAMGIPLEDMLVWDFRKPFGGTTPEALAKAKIILWDGWCSVHQRFEKQHIDDYRQKYPDTVIVAHPESPFDVCQAADVVGSTSLIQKTIEQAPQGTRFLVATELNLVNRLHRMHQHEEKVVDFMAPTVSMCSTMFRTDPQHLAWVLKNLVQRNLVNRVTVPEPVASSARAAIERMFDITQSIQATPIRG